MNLFWQNFKLWLTLSKIVHFCTNTFNPKRESIKWNFFPVIYQRKKDRYECKEDKNLNYILSSGALNDDTKILTETDTETFFRYQIFRNRYRDFFSDTKFSETETDTLKKLAKVSKPKPILFSRDQIFRNLNRDFFPRQIFSQTETETFFPRPKCPKPKPKPSKIWQKSRDRDLNRDFSTSFKMKFGKCGTTSKIGIFGDQNWGL